MTTRSISRLADRVQDQETADTAIAVLEFAQFAARMSDSACDLAKAVVNGNIEIVRALTTRINRETPGIRFAVAWANADEAVRHLLATGGGTR